MRTLVFLSLVSIFLLNPSTLLAADESCAALPQSGTTQTESRRQVVEFEWKRAIDQDKVEDIVRLLPEADVKITNEKGKTALMAAVKTGDYCLLQELLQRGLKISDKGYTGGTTLMYAVLGNQSEMIDRILTYKPELNAQSTNGWTAVMIAAAKGFDAAIKVLYTAGADVNLADVYGWTPLMRSIENRHRLVVEYLLSLPDIDLEHVNENGSTVLHIAAQVGDAATVTQLLQRNVNRDIEDKNGYSPVEIATMNGRGELAELIGQFTK